MVDSALPLGVTDGRGEFTASVRQMLLELPQRAPRDLWLIDSEFDAWPLDEAAVLDALTAWRRPAGRTLHIVASDFKVVQRRFPRFSAWRLPRTHAFEAWQPLPDERVALSAVLLAESVALELLDATRWRARRVSDRAPLRTLQENLAALLHRCQSAWPATTLGL